MLRLCRMFMVSHQDTKIVPSVCGFAIPLRYHSSIQRMYHKPKEREVSHDTYRRDFSFVSLIKDCTKKKDANRGTKIHAELYKNGLLEKSPYLASCFISMYAKCGMLEKAQQVLEELPVHDTVCWSALIAGYAQHGQGHDAVKCFDRMQNEGLSADVIAFICILKACGTIGAIDKGKQIHEEIASRDLLMKDVILGTALIDMYAKCGALMKARRVFDEIPVRNIVSWNAVISGCVQHGEYHNALTYFEHLKNEGLQPNVVTFSCTLKACGNIGAIHQGKNIHNEILDRRLLGKDIVLGTALVDMYAKCGVLEKAQGVLDELSIRDVISWNALLVGYAEHDQNHEIINCFERMQNEGLHPDIVTFVCVLKACANIGAIEKGEQIHKQIMSIGSLDKDITVGSALVDMYAKCGLLDKAKKVLEDLPVRNMITWNALVSGYAKQGQYHEALSSFEQMQTEGVFPDLFTFICILKACGCVGAIEKGIKIHEKILSRGLAVKDLMFLGTALVDMYAKCGVLVKAQKVLEELSIRDVVSWSALIAGYVQQEKYHEALSCLEGMQKEGLSPDAITWTCILNAYGCIGAVDKGIVVHDVIRSKGLLEKHIVLGNALVDMYAKCGVLTKSQQVLEEIPLRDVVSWSTVISAYAQQRYGYEALHCFERMQNEGISPNEITYLSVLRACCQSGLLDEAQIVFHNMKLKYHITPSLEHYTCMVVVFGCAGEFDKAVSIIAAMPSFDSLDIWLALLNGCKKWGNIKLGRLSFDQAIQLDFSSAAAYVLAAGMFSEASLQEDAEKVELMRLTHCAYI